MDIHARFSGNGNGCMPDWMDVEEWDSIKEWAKMFAETPALVTKPIM